jgi:DNA polymerase-1
MASDAKERLYLIDAHSLVFQVFHAIGEMTSPAGLPTNAVFGFVRDLMYLRSQNPEYLICAFDRTEPTFRSQLYADYKAHRPEMPSSLQVQIPLIYKAVEALNIPALGVPGFEADDVMATVAHAAADKGIHVRICTSDKDCRQLLRDGVRIYNLRKRREFGEAELLDEWGIRPDQVVDLQTLVGDSVDNVPGVEGIGYKTAAKLLQEFGTLENLLQNIDKVPGKKRENLKAALPTLPISRKLVRLDPNVPIPMDWDAWRLRDPDTPKAVKLFTELGFRSLAAQIRGDGIVSVKDEPPAANEKAEPSQGELFPFGANTPEEDTQAAKALPTGSLLSPSGGWVATYHLVDTQAKLERFIKELEKQALFIFDLETTSLSPLEADIVGLAFSWQAGEAHYLAVRGPKGSRLLDPADTLARLKPLFEDPKRQKVNQNIKYDWLVLRGHGIDVRGVVGDPMVADYLLHSGERSHGMEELSRRYLNHQVIVITDLIGKKTKKQPQLRMDEVPASRVAEYSGEDADVAFRLRGILEPELAQAPGGRLKVLYDTVEIPLIEVLVELEANGIRLDVPILKKLGQEMEGQLTAIEKEIYALAGHEFNIGSLVQLRKVLFEELKLPTQRKTGVTGAASTDQETLERLAGLNLPGAKLPAKILEHRQIAKLKSTYVDLLPEMVNKKTGRVHTSFNQTVTSTGRLSASDPNLQNIPVRREMGQQIRQAFLPEKGWTLLTADYSQIELRLLAHFCGDAELRKAFHEDRDIHTMVAAEIYRVAEKDVTADQRRVAKTVNFGVIYGMSAGGLAARLRIPREEAERFIDAYFARYPLVLKYQDRLLKDCIKTSYVGTILGRRRRIDGIMPGSTYQKRGAPEREAINMEVQGSAADLIKLAMLRVYRKLKDQNRRSRMLLQIHDELVFETPPEELLDVARMVRDEMSKPLEKELELQVPLKVDLSAGPNWLDVDTIPGL